jgi:hypothetical protein
LGTVRTPNRAAFFAAGELGIALARFAESLQRTLAETRLRADLLQHREIADVGAFLEKRTEDGRGHIRMAAFVRRELHQAMSSDVLGKAPSFLEVELEAEFSPGLGQTLFRETARLMPGGSRSAR